MKSYEYKCGCGETAVGTKAPLCKCGRWMYRDWTTNIAFHGGGFYSTDNRSAG